MSSNMQIKRPRGRPRGFDDRHALDAAMRIFWSNGYEAASVDMLSRGMGVPRASLYSAFGNKESLFLEAVSHYVEGPFAETVKQLHCGGALRDDLIAFFDGVVRLTAGHDGSRGCLVSCVLADAAGTNDVFRQELARRLGEVEFSIALRLEKGIAAGDLPSKAPKTALAGVLSAVARGLTVAARAGTEAEDLLKTARASIDLMLDQPAA